MRVLVVDDSRAVRVMLSRMLRELGHETAQAEHGADALFYLNREDGDSTDLVLVDWNMPVMDGYTFIKEVRSQPEFRDLTMMMVTTEVDGTQMVRALAAGANEYLMKPFVRDDLSAKIDLLFGRSN